MGFKGRRDMIKLYHVDIKKMAKYIKINDEQFDIEDLKLEYINSPYFKHYDLKSEFKSFSSFYTRYDKKRRQHELQILNKSLSPENIDKIKSEMKLLHLEGRVAYWLVLFPLCLFLSIIGIVVFSIQYSNRGKIHNDFMKAIAIYSLNPNMPSLYKNNDEEIYI